MNRPSRSLLVVFVVLAVLIPYWWMARQPAGPSPSALQRAPEPPPTHGGTLVVSARSEPRSFNRMVSRDFPSELFALLTQGRLVRVNRETQEVEPWLAETWDLDEDGRTWTLRLRDGVRWSDDVPFTAADVVFTFEVLHHPEVPAVLATAFTFDGQPVEVSAPDSQTVVITYPVTFGPGIRQLDNLVIVPKHRLEPALRDGTFARAWSAATSPEALVGLGPFRLTRYEPGQRLVYERNPRYWRRDAHGNPLPYLDGIVMEIVPEQDAEMVRLQAGQIDFPQQQLRAEDIAPVRALADHGRLQLLELGVSTDPDSFFFNLRPERWANDPRGAWLPRKEFRQAISHAIDREGFAHTVFLGEAVPINGPITPGNRKWFSPDVPRYPFSPEKARALLEGLGLRSRDAGGWLEDERGSEVRFTLQTFRGATVLERSAEVIRDDLRQVGIAVDVVALEPNTVIQRMQDGQFEAVLMAFQVDLDPAMNKDFWLSSGSAHVWHPNQPAPATEWERDIDTLMLRQASTLDEGERRRLFNEVQRIFAEHLPIIHLAAPRIYMGVSPRVINMSPAVSRPQLLWSPDTLAVRGGGQTR